MSIDDKFYEVPIVTDKITVTELNGNIVSAKLNFCNIFSGIFIFNSAVGVFSLPRKGQHFINRRL
jgi:hypothetical protein